MGRLQQRNRNAGRSVSRAFVLDAARGLKRRNAQQASDRKRRPGSILDGGMVAGSLGMLCCYAAIKGAPLGQVMPIAFTAPLFGVLMGILHGGEPLTLKTLVGMALTIGGIVALTIG